MTNDRDQHHDVDRLLAEVAISDILKVAGVSNLGADPAPEALHAAMKRLGEFLAGADALVKQSCTIEAVKQLRRSGLDAESARKLVATALRQDGPPVEDDQFQTIGETPTGAVIVDVVRRGDGVAWVVAWPGTGKVEITERVAGRVLWPSTSLPWAGIPAARAVEQARDRGTTGRELFQTLVDLYRAPPPNQLFVLPEPQGVTAALLALWVMGTYLLDAFNYYPALLLEGPHSRGKTRFGNAAVFLARRGIDTANPTPANIFRHRSRHLASYFIDVYDLPRRMDQDRDFTDVVLGSFERDKKVWRVTRPDADPPKQQEGFAVFGATVLASNHALRDDHPLASRCLRMRMPERGDVQVRPALRPTDPGVLQLRAELVAWAAEWTAAGEPLPALPQVLQGRLHDIGSPLLRVARLVYPAVSQAVTRWLRETDAQRRVGESESREARLVGALVELRRQGQWARSIGVKQVTEHVNRDTEAGEIKVQSVAWLTKHLGLERMKRKGYSYIVYPGDEAWNALLDRYGRAGGG